MDFVGIGFATDVQGAIWKGGRENFLEAFGDECGNFLADIGGYFFECGNLDLDDIATSVLAAISCREGGANVEESVVERVCRSALRWSRRVQVVGFAPAGFEFFIDLAKDFLELFFPFPGCVVLHIFHYSCLRVP